jgi:hypothetical protein
MTAPLEKFGKILIKEGYTEIGQGLKDMAEMGRKIGMPKELPRTAVVFEPRVSRERPETLEERMALWVTVKTGLIDAGIPERSAVRLVRAVDHDIPWDDAPIKSPLGNVRSAQDFSRITNVDLLEAREIGTKTLAELRAGFPYQSPQGKAVK